jgi:uncharacterized membrane protein
MDGWRAKIGLALLTTVVVSIGVAAPGLAQEATTSSSVQVLTPYTGVAVEPGDTASFPLQVTAPTGDEVDLAVVGVPEGWDAQIRAGGYVIDRVMFDEALSHDLKLDVNVPPDAVEGDYQMSVVATGPSSSDRLDVDLVVAQAVGGGVSLNAEFPSLQGPADTQFSFSLDLANDTGDEVQFGLQAQGPTGWQVTARPSGQSLASTVTVAAGSSERITVEVDPPDSAAAGVYPITVEAAGGGDTASADLSVEITGNFDLVLTTLDDRLNADVEAGKATDVQLAVINQGSAPLTGVSLTATPPQGWDVTYSPSSIDQIEPGGSAAVTATITPSGDAIAGDYRITLGANVAETGDSIELRATVETSALWGLVGVGLILVALAALALVFRRFGRR